MSAPAPFSRLSLLRDHLNRVVQEENVLILLLAVRWLSLLPPVLGLVLGAMPLALGLPIFGLALLNNILLSIFSERLNRLVLRSPSLLGIDMAMAAFFLSLTGGIYSPYLLYSYMPVLLASFLFQIHGGMRAAAAFTVFYVASLVIAVSRGDMSASLAVDLHVALTQIISFFLAGVVFGYPAVLLRRLRGATAQLQSAQRDLVQAETLAAVGKLTSHVSHEIRNPLSTIGGFARSILRRPAEAERVRNNAQIIADEVVRLEEFLTSMLDVSRPARPEMRPVNLHDLLDKAWLLAGGIQSDHNRVSVRKDYDSAPPTIEADASSLLRAFLNIMRNAVQIMEEGDGGTLTITTRCRKDAVEVGLTDTGPGIPPEVLPQLFKPFTTRREHGTGLGLAITEEIISHHGGRVEARNEPGKGAHFSICLPTRHCDEGEPPASEL